MVADNDLRDEDDLIFVEVTVGDPSDFETDLDVRGEVLHDRVPGAHARASSSVANALAALLLHVRDLTGVRPHIYFEWTEGNPAANFLRFLFFGEGEIAPGHPGDPAPGRTRPRPPTARARRLTVRRSPSSPGQGSSV